jgi:hypothetical protein
MTNEAWVTGIVKVSDGGLSMYALKPNQTFIINGSDQGVDLGTKAVAITGTHNFQTGVISGNPPFFVGEKSPTTTYNLRVDMTWSCESDDSTWTVLDRPTGYQFSLDDIGCDVKQSVTLRPLTSPNRIEWSIYGNPNDFQVTPMSSGNFVFDYEGLFVEGTVNSYNGSSASVDLDTIELDGSPICDTGTYTFYAE